MIISRVPHKLRGGSAVNWQSYPASGEPGKRPTANRAHTEALTAVTRPETRVEEAILPLKCFTTTEMNVMETAREIKMTVSLAASLDVSLAVSRAERWLTRRWWTWGAWATGRRTRWSRTRRVPAWRDPAGPWRSAGPAGAAGRRGVTQARGEATAQRPGGWSTRSCAISGSDDVCDKLGLDESSDPASGGQPGCQEPIRVRGSGNADTETGLGLVMSGSRFEHQGSQQTGRRSADRPGRGDKHETRRYRRQSHFLSTSK